MRHQTRRRYLMCPPTHFGVTYSINPWMHVGKPVDADLAVHQWETLRDLYLSFGHEVELIDPVPGLPDMVFTANGATVADGRVLMAKFRHEERAAEADAFRAWFAQRSFREVRDPERINEGEGDLLVDGGIVLAGTGFRTDIEAHEEVRRFFGRPVITLNLADPRFYHLDTALAVLGHGQIMYYPAAFSSASRDVLAALYPDAIIATDADAEVFGLNAVSDGRNVVLPQPATHLIGELRKRGFQPHGVDISELLKAGGAVKCCTLELRGAKPSGVHE